MQRAILARSFSISAARQSAKWTRADFERTEAGWAKDFSEQQYWGRDDWSYQLTPEEQRERSQADYLAKLKGTDLTVSGVKGIFLDKIYLIRVLREKLGNGR